MYLNWAHFPLLSDTFLEPSFDVWAKLLIWALFWVKFFIWALFWGKLLICPLFWPNPLVWALFWALKKADLLSKVLFWAGLLSRVLFWALCGGLLVHQNLPTLNRTSKSKETLTLHRTRWRTICPRFFYRYRKVTYPQQDKMKDNMPTPLPVLLQPLCCLHWSANILNI